MAEGTIAARPQESKEELRGTLTEHEIGLIHEMAESGMAPEEIAARFV